MKIRLRIFLTVFITFGVGFLLFINWISNDLKPQFRATAEEPMVDTAWTLAALASTQVRDGRVDVTVFRRMFDHLSQDIPPAPIYRFLKTTIDLRVYLTDGVGTVIFDSTGRDEGADYSRWNDVLLTLQGKYGTRTSTDPGQGQKASIMYVAAPIRARDALIGVVSVGKPTVNVNALVATFRESIVFGGVLTFASVILVTLLVSAMITRPLEKLIAYTRSISDGKSEPLPRLGSGEMGRLGRAFLEMRMALEGRKYIENYVQALTHELKSPIAAIQGAAELLDEEMPTERRRRFHENIASETKRMQTVVERLLVLAAVENRSTPPAREKIELLAVVQRATEDSAATAMAMNVTIRVSNCDPVLIHGEEGLVEQAVANVLHNALEFSPSDGIIDISVRYDDDQVLLTVEDQGPGIPDYALPKVFDRFYSLHRPHSGRKSSGLGLSLVREIMMLHSGSVTLDNRNGGGARATLAFRP